MGAAERARHVDQITCHLSCITEPYKYDFKKVTQLASFGGKMCYVKLRH